jgi:hypothetical protein
VQPKLETSIGLKAEPKPQVSVLISAPVKLGISVLILAQAEIKTETINFSCAVISPADHLQTICGPSATHPLLIPCSSAACLLPICRPSTACLQPIHFQQKLREE